VFGEGASAGGLGSDLVGALAQQLEEAQAQLAVVAPQAAAAEVHVQQQQRHVQQLAGELQAAKAAQKAADEKGEVLQVRLPQQQHI
jgi:chromosome segregation ATPase